ncbi:dihydrofolate synthase / folylpolyglutamate synthase [Desulfonatronum thiosulfatophilum]|uniref:Dihydrofolate synthase/folylpolyglutamate synthase n=1 Tax=Desulfonatronum thiosulfatophilum TaxID=617002 RepID=A0A1G6BDG4_9BACT|nr:cyanophycin synthetase [Desulfonatronum thiosulfatophilum]SDB18667.1 dihydrofolate synthase / folylpolyglutamate synthase [Desulfonatronum thiosulfatophilum]
MFHMRLGFDRMRQAVKRLDIARPPMTTVQVVGTNGKGSTSFFLARIAQEHGFATGLFTSPHFLTLRERIRINGRPASEEKVLEWANIVQEKCADLGLTYFETITLIAMVGFRREGVDLAVLEAGLGGLNDATTTWDPDLLLVTPIGLDHEQIIGPGLVNIALDKAGAVKTGSTVVSARQEPAVLVILGTAAALDRANLFLADEQWAVPGTSGSHLQNPSEPLPALPGAHQRTNAGLALAGWSRLCDHRGWTVRPEACRRALADAGWPGRLQRIPGTPEFILDGAHNPPAVKALAAALKELEIRPAAVVFTCLQDKDLAAMAPLVRAMTDGPILVPGLPTYQRTRQAAEVCQILGPRAKAVQDAAAALRETRQLSGPVLICGSLYLLAETYAQHPEWLDCCAA